MEGPSPQRLAETLAKVGRSRLLVSADRVALVERGAAIDSERHRAGIRHGPCLSRSCTAQACRRRWSIWAQIRAIGVRPEGTPWRVGLADPDKPGTLTETIDLVDRAVATSAGAGFRFDSTGRFTHLFNPKDGTEPVAVQHRERDCANCHRSGCAFDRVQPDAVVADPGHRGYATERSGSHRRSRRNFDHIGCLRCAGPAAVRTIGRPSTADKMKSSFPKGQNRRTGCVDIFCCTVGGRRRG